MFRTINDLNAYTTDRLAPFTDGAPISFSPVSLLPGVDCGSDIFLKLAVRNSIDPQAFGESMVQHLNSKSFSVSHGHLNFFGGNNPEYLRANTVSLSDNEVLALKEKERYFFIQVQKEFREHYIKHIFHLSEVMHLGCSLELLKEFFLIPPYFRGHHVLLNHWKKIIKSCSRLFFICRVVIKQQSSMTQFRLTVKTQIFFGGFLSQSSV